jgi:hypothetical protein
MKKEIKLGEIYEIGSVFDDKDKVKIVGLIASGTGDSIVEYRYLGFKRLFGI